MVEFGSCPLAHAVMVSLIHEEGGRTGDHIRFRIRDQHLSHWRNLGYLPKLILQTGKQGLLKGQWLARGHTSLPDLRIQAQLLLSTQYPYVHPLLLTTSYNLCGQKLTMNSKDPQLYKASLVAGGPRQCWQVCLSTGQGQVPSITLRHAVKLNLKKETTEYQDFHMIAPNSSQNGVLGAMEVPMALSVGL